MLICDLGLMKGEQRPQEARRMPTEGQTVDSIDRLPCLKILARARFELSFAESNFAESVCVQHEVLWVVTSLASTSEFARRPANHPSQPYYVGPS